MFKLTFIYVAHLLVGGPSNMVFKHLWDVFDLKDSTNDFSLIIFSLFLCCYRAYPWKYSKALGAVRLLVLAKPFGGI
jgi:uncharacterized protein (DUF486 family)